MYMHSCTTHAASFLRSLRYFEDIPQMALSSWVLQASGKVDAASILNLLTSAALVAAHVLKDVAEEVKRLWKQWRARRQAGSAKGADDQSASVAGGAEEGGRHCTEIFEELSSLQVAGLLLIVPLWLPVASGA